MHDDDSRERALRPDVERFATELDRLLDQDPKRALSAALSAPEHMADEPEVRLLLGIARSLVDGPDAARAELEQLASDQPHMADVRHALGRVYEACDDSRRAAIEYLEAWQLDAAADERQGFDFSDVNQRVLDIAHEVVNTLPLDLRSRLSKVPIVVEARPDKYLVERGFDPRSVGLFEGPDHREHLWEVPTLLPRIVIYAANLLASVDLDDSDELQRQIEITLLHEIGHYFGLDEERLHELGLG